MALYKDTKPSRRVIQFNKTNETSPLYTLTESVLSAIAQFSRNGDQDTRMPTVSLPSMQLLSETRPDCLHPAFLVSQQQSSSDSLIQQSTDSSPVGCQRQQQVLPGSTTDRDSTGSWTPPVINQWSYRVRKAHTRRTAAVQNSCTPSSPKYSDSPRSSLSSSSTDPHSNPRGSRVRRRLKIEETEYLLDQFEMNEKPNGKERAAFAAHLKLDPRTIQVWFQNRRAKLKRDDCLAKHLMTENEDLKDEEYENCPYRECRSQDMDTDKTESESTDAAFNQIHEDAHVSKAVLAEDSFHIGRGSETFLGYEHSEGDAGWNRLFQCEPPQLPNLDDLPQTLPFIGDDGTTPIFDFFDMSTLDFGFGLGYEIGLGLESVGFKDQRLEGELPASGIHQPFEDTRASPLAIPMDITVEDVKPTFMPGFAFSRVGSRCSSIVSKTLSSRYNLQRVELRKIKPGDVDRSLSYPPMRRATLMARRHNQIPRQQLAFTLVPNPSDSQA